MENNHFIKKLLATFGILISIPLFGIIIAVIYQTFNGEVSMDAELLVYIAVGIFANILILRASFRALSKKEKKEKKQIKPITLFIGCLLFCAILIFIGITSDVMQMTWAGFTLLIIILAMTFSMLKDSRILKNNTEEDAQKIFASKGNHGGLIALLVLIGAIIFGFLLTGLVMDSVVLGDGANAGMADDSRECRSCDRAFSDSSNSLSIAKTGMCKNCYGNYKDLEWVLGE